MPSHSEVEASAPPLTVEGPPRAAYAWRRPEVIVPAVLLAVACVVRYDAEPRGFISGFAAAVLVVLAATDLLEGRVSNRIVLPAIGLVFTAQLVFYPERAAEFFLAGLGAGLFLFVPTVFERGAIGMGDVKLGVLLGVTLGAPVLSAMTIGFVALLPLALYTLWQEGVSARKKSLPLGPFFAFGAAVVLLTGGANGF